MRGGRDGEEIEGDSQPHVPGDGRLADGGGCAGVEEGDETKKPLKRKGEKEKGHVELEHSYISAPYCVYIVYDATITGMMWDKSVVHCCHRA